MSRPIRLEYPGAVYHVTSRGNEQRIIFVDDHDRATFLKLLGDAVLRFRWILTSYVLMSNHFHFVIELTRANLARGMHWLNGKYAQRFNRNHRRVGHLYQGRYGAPVIDKENYMLEVVRYVVLNPVRAHMIKRPEDYELSSYRATVGLAPAPPWLAVDNVLALFGTDDRAVAQKRYRQFVRDGMRSDRVPWDDLVGQIYLGSQPWIDEVRARVAAKLRPDEHPRLQRDVGTRSMADIITSVADIFDMSEGWVRAGHGGIARMAAAWLGCYEGQLTLSAIAAGLRLRSAGHVSNLIRRCDEALSSDAKLRSSLDQCTELLHHMWKTGEAKA